MKRFISKKEGFTLIELLVVISIIGLLSSVVLASLSKARQKGRDAKRVQDVVQMRTALELYAADHDGHYPVNTQAGADFESWVTSNPGCYTYVDGSAGVVMAAGLVSGKYISSIPQDPKPLGSGKCYMYYAPSGGNYYKFSVMSTVETFDPLATNHTLKDPKRGFSFAAKTPIDPEDL